MFTLKSEDFDKLIMMTESVIETQDTGEGSGVMLAANSFLDMVLSAKERGESYILIEDEEVVFLSEILGGI